MNRLPCTPTSHYPTHLPVTPSEIESLP
jgi:hypothetical protein